jgi:hypothetical protein
MAEEAKNEENIEEGQIVEVEEPQTESQEVSEPEVEAQAEEPVEKEEENPEELEDYSERVQKRISSLTRRLREEERAKESALTYAQQLQEQNKQLSVRSNTLDRSYLTEAENRLKSQRSQATAALKAAHEAQDYDKVAQAQDVLAKIAVEESRVKQSQIQQEAVANQGQTEQSPIAPQPIAQPDPKAQDWADKNTWFGEDESMTLTAFNIHRNLVENEGFDPSSDEYYTEVDKRIRSEFPHKFESPKKPQQRVASAGRVDTNTSGKKQVRLTPSEVQMAKKLNVPLNEYAKFVKR